MYQNIFGLDVLAVCKFIDGKITYIHRRPWAACARLADELGAERLDLIHSVQALGQVVLSQKEKLVLVRPLEDLLCMTVLRLPSPHPS